VEREDTEERIHSPVEEDEQAWLLAAAAAAAAAALPKVLQGYGRALLRHADVLRAETEGCVIV